MYGCYMKPNPFPLTDFSDLLKSLKPFTAEESRRCFEAPNLEFDALSAHCASLPVPVPEE